MNVLLADDHSIVRAGLKQLLESHSSISKVFEVPDGKSAVEVIETQEIDLVVLDISMPEMSGVEVLEKFRDRDDVLFLVLSMYPEKEFAIMAFRLGASGYISKDSAPEELHLAIDTVLSGQKFISNNMKEFLVDLKTDQKKLRPHESLSSNELKVFLFLVNGKRIGEIADLMCISVKTVSTYKSRIMTKMEIDSVQGLVKYALNHKIMN